MKAIFISVNENIVHTRKYQIPFFIYHTFNLGFLWVLKKKILVGFVEERKLVSTTLPSSKKDKVVTMEIDPLKDIPIDAVKENILNLVRQYDLEIPS